MYIKCINIYLYNPLFQLEHISVSECIISYNSSINVHKHVLHARQRILDLLSVAYYAIYEIIEHYTREDNVRADNKVK